MLQTSLRSLLASLTALALLARIDGATVAHASSTTIQILHAGAPSRLLAPGADFVVLASGSALPPGACLGLASLRDPGGIPVSLGSFRAVAGSLAVHARVPLSVFPAEPPGPFLLFVGRCTDVAPDGNYASATITILPAAG